jgi:hypothetical protein
VGLGPEFRIILANCERGEHAPRDAAPDVLNALFCESMARHNQHELASAEIAVRALGKSFTTGDFTGKLPR